MPKTAKQQQWLEHWTKIYGAMSLVQLNFQLNKLAKIKKWTDYTDDQHRHVQLIIQAMNNQRKVIALINPGMNEESLMKQMFTDINNTGLGVARRFYDPEEQHFKIERVDHEVVQNSDHRKIQHMTDNAQLDAYKYLESVWNSNQKTS